MPGSRPPTREPRGPRARSALIAALLVLGSACTVGDAVPPGADPAAEGADGGPEGSVGADAPGAGLVIVLPPVDAVATSERDVVRTAVETVLDASDRTVRAPTVLEPATGASVGDAIEVAVRRAGGDGTVCLVGSRGRAQLAVTLARYPAARACVVPGPGPLAGDETRVGVGDLDLQGLGRSIGEAARAASGDGSILVLDGDDALLDVRWLRGVEEGVDGASDVTGSMLGVVTSAADALRVLDEQAALLERGIVPGTPLATPPGTPPGPLDDEGPDARSLRPVTVVVLDVGPDSERLAASLAGRPVLVVLPTSMFRSGAVPSKSVVLHWSVRWDVALTAALAGGGDGSTVVDPGATFHLEPGPAAVAP